MLLSYILRRLIYAIPVLIGVNVLTFALFFMVNSPDDMARMQLGGKHVTQESIATWKQAHGYNKPLFHNTTQRSMQQLTDTLFWQQSLKLAHWEFGLSEQGRNIGHDIKERMWPSLALAVPTLIIGLLVNLTWAMITAFFRGTYIDKLSMCTCVVLLSISGLFYIIFGQYLVGKLLQLVPISGYQPGWQSAKFLILPVMIGVVSGLGSGVRWYRTIFLEEVHQEYVRTARAKGLSESIIMFRHVLRNALIPVVTTIVSILPLLFMGSLLMESFFGIPGLGSYTIEAIQQQDFSIVRAMVFLGTLLTLLGLLLTDIVYTLVDPRVQLK